MKTIWKYPLMVTDLQTVEMPEISTPLTVQCQDDTPCLWVLVDPSARMGKRLIRIYGTGHQVRDNGTYIGTFQMHDGALVFHVFDATFENKTSEP